MSRWSYSKLSTYEKCPSKKKYKYDLRVEVTTPQHPAALRGNQLHADLENNLGKSLYEVPEWIRPHHPHLERYQNGQKEQRIELDNEWAPLGDNTEEEPWLVAIIDLCDVKDLYATVVDYKSGKRYSSHPEQIELYSLSVLCKLPELARVEGLNYYLDEKPGSWGKPVYVTRDAVPEVKARWNSRVLMMDSDTECAPRPGFYCKWCEYSKTSGGPCQFG